MQKWCLIDFFPIPDAKIRKTMVSPGTDEHITRSEKSLCPLWLGSLVIILHTLHCTLLSGVDLCHYTTLRGPVTVYFVSSTGVIRNGRQGEAARVSTHARILTRNSLVHWSNSFSSLVCLESSTWPSLHTV